MNHQNSPKNPSYNHGTDCADAAAADDVAAAVQRAISLMENASMAFWPSLHGLSMAVRGATHMQRPHRRYPKSRQRKEYRLRVV